MCAHVYVLMYLFLVHVCMCVYYWYTYAFMHWYCSSCACVFSSDFYTYTYASMYINKSMCFVLCLRIYAYSPMIGELHVYMSLLCISKSSIPMCIYLCVVMYVSVCSFMLCTSVSTAIFTFLYFLSELIHIDLYTYAHACMHACIYTYICIHVYIDTYVCVHMRTHTHVFAIVMRTDPHCLLEIPVSRRTLQPRGWLSCIARDRVTT